MPKPANSLVREIALAVQKAGGRAFMVGGCVRDGFYGVEPKDIDTEVFGIEESRIEALVKSVAPHVIRVEGDFPVFKAWTDEIGAGNPVDVALPRREVKTGSRHGDFDVTADPHMTLAEASSRRDFSINAIYLDPITGEIQDPQGGIADIKKGVLRHVSPRFAEDPLRVLRGMQFSGRFELTADPETIEFCKGLSADDLPSERLLEEFKKLILRAKKPSKGLSFLVDTGWDRYFPELAALKGVQQDPTWHPEGDAFVHTGHCLDAFAKRRTGNDERDLRVGLAVLCHDFGKATHTKRIDGRWTSHGHEEAGEAPTDTFLRRLTNQSELIHGVIALVTRHMVPGSLHQETLKNGRPESMDSSIRRLALHLGREGVPLDELCTVCECDKAGRPPLPESSAAVEWLRSRAEVAKVLHEKPRAFLMGRDLIALGMKPGVSFKAILEDAFTRQINGDITSHDQAVAFARENREFGRELPALPTPSPSGAGITKEL